MSSIDSAPSRVAPTIAVDLDDVLAQTNQAVADCAHFNHCHYKKLMVYVQGYNEEHGTAMVIDDFHCELTPPFRDSAALLTSLRRLSLLEGMQSVVCLLAIYTDPPQICLQNPYWGTPDETHNKVKQFYVDKLMSPKPVPGALEGLKHLKALGYKLVIVTARHRTEEMGTRAWLEEYYPGELSETICERAMQIILGIIEDVICTGQFQKDEEGNEEHVKLSKAEVCDLVKLSLHL